MATVATGADVAGPPQGCPSPPDGPPRGEPALTAAGWRPRFLADAERTEEAVRLYESLGFETLARPLTPESLGALCGECQVVACQRYTLIYTRREGAAHPRK